MKFYDLKINKILQETSDTLIIYLEIPNELKDKFMFISGQYITISEIINDKEVRRSYSLCGVPGEKNIAFGVKKVDGGLMSTFIHQKYKAGRTISVSEPEGKFIVEPDDKEKKSHFFFAAGSGITPIISMIKTLLEEEPLSKVYLLYGNRNEQAIIFKENLDALKSKYSGQLEIEYTISKPKTRKASGMLSFLKPKIIDWQGYVGRISDKMIQLFLNSYPNAEGDHYYICGPGDLIDNTENTLLNMGIEGKAIHKEYFVSNTRSKTLSEKDAHKAEITVKLNGESFSYQSEGKLTLLEEIINLKKDPPYSCTSGACSSCLAKVTEGKVKMDVCYALEDDEVEAGYILTCQSRAITDKLSIEFE